MSILPVTALKNKLRSLRQWLAKRWRLILSLLVIIPTCLAVAYTWLPTPATPLMVWRLFEGEGWTRTWVPLKKLPAIIPQAVIASEDNLFCQHRGVDWQAVEHVYQEWRSGEGLRGASTISMQVARNLFLWPGQDPIRKGLEVIITYGIETLWSKARIMEIYLNVVEWGPGVYGIEAASLHHFGKSAKRLTREEVFRLVSILPSPRRWNPTSHRGWMYRNIYRLENRVAQLQGAMDCVKRNR